MNAIETKYFTISENRIPSLKEKLQKMINKAQKLGIEGCSYSVDTTNPSDVPYLDGKPYSGKNLKAAEDAGIITYRRFYRVSIDGPSPVLAGWEFVAALEHLSDDKGQPMNILRCRPSFEGNLPTHFRNASCKCDHCHTQRNRKASFVVRNIETQEFKQVGSSCIKDFCGGNDPRQVAAMLEWDLETNFDEDADDEGGMGGGHCEKRWSLREFLAATCAVIRTEGWLSKSKAEEYGPAPTVVLVLEHLHNKG